MDHVTARDATRLGAHHRRWRMRERARSRHLASSPVSDRYQTPEWLERSFVLPLTQPEGNDVPSQPVRGHDDDPVPEGQATPRPEAAAARTPSLGSAGFVRPPSEDVDFARVIRRADLSRQVTRLHWLATGLAGVALVVFLLVSSTVALVAVAALAVLAVGAFAVRLRLHRAPVPHVER